MKNAYNNTHTKLSFKKPRQSYSSQNTKMTPGRYFGMPALQGRSKVKQGEISERLDNRLIFLLCLLIAADVTSAVSTIDRVVVNTDASFDAFHEEENVKRKNEIKKRIVSSPRATSLIAENKTLLRKVNKFPSDIHAEASKNVFLFCQLAFLVSHPTFKIELATKSEMQAKTDSNYQAFYSQFEKAISIPVSRLGSRFFNAMVTHEIHHNFIDFQNAEKSYLFAAPSLEGKPRIDTLSTPCLPTPNSLTNGEVNCDEIRKIQNFGFFIVEKFLMMIDSPKKITSQPEWLQSLFTEYLAAVSEYTPADIEGIVSEQQISLYKKAGYIDEDLSIIASNGRLMEGSGWWIKKITAITEKSGATEYIVSGAFDKNNKAPLKELLLFAESYGATPRAPSNTEAKVFFEGMIELDAVIFQLLGKYPLLMNILFPNLMIYHLERATPDYQECVTHQLLHQHGIKIN